VHLDVTPYGCRRFEFLASRRHLGGISADGPRRFVCI